MNFSGDRFTSYRGLHRLCAFYQVQGVLQEKWHLQGKPPQRPDMLVLKPKVETEVAPPPPKHQPVVTDPHPTIPGHRWPTPVVHGRLHSPCEKQIGKLFKTYDPVQSETPSALVLAASGMCRAGNPIVHEDVEPSIRALGAQTSSLTSRCPFFLDENYAAPASEHRAARLERAAATWAAHAQSSPKTPARHPLLSDLLPADRMWLDVTSGRQMMETFPSRQYLGRYRS